jgi:hypothetical protein
MIVIAWLIWVDTVGLFKCHPFGSCSEWTIELLKLSPWTMRQAVHWHTSCCWKHYHCSYWHFSFQWPLHGATEEQSKTFVPSSVCSQDVSLYCAHMASTVHDAASCALEGVRTTHLQCLGFTAWLPHVGFGDTVAPAATQGLLDRRVVGCLL